METQLDRKIELAENLSRERELEYRKANSSVAAVSEVTNDLENKMRVAAQSMLGAFSSVHIPRSMPVMSGQAFAAGLTAVILGASVTLAGSGVVARAGEILLASAFEVRALVVEAISTSDSLAVVKTAEFSRIAEDQIKKIDTTLVGAADARVVMLPTTLGEVIESSHEPVVMNEIAYAHAREIFETYPKPLTSVQIAESILYTGTNPEELVAAIAHEAMLAYNRLGAYALNDIETILALHMQGVEMAANGLLSASATTRDVAGRTPLVIGNAFLTASSATLSSYERAIYAYVENIETVPSVIAGTVYGLGNGIGGSVAMGIQTAPVVYDAGVLAFVEDSISAGSMISEGSFAFGQEADRTVSGLLEAENRAIVQSVEGAKLALTGVGNGAASAVLAIESVPSVATDRVLGVMGNIALRIERADASVLSAAPLVSLDIDRFIPGFLRNVTAVLAHAVGSAFHGVFGPLAGFFGASEEVGLAVIPNDGSSFSGPDGEISTEEAVKGSTTVYNGPVTIVRNEYPTVNYSGVSQAYVDERFALLRRTLYTRVVDRTSDTIYGEIRDADIIDSRITGSTFANGTITGGTITGATLDVASTTVTGSLTVNGDVAVNGITATSSTITNATSTNLFATNASFTNLLGGNATITNATSTNLYAAVARVVDGFFTNFTATLATITNAVITNLTATNATLTNATSTSATSTNLFATNLTATSATSTNLFATGARFTTGIIDALTSPLATITTAVITNLTATNSTLTNATSTNAFALTYVTPSRLLSIGSNGVATSTALSSWVTGTLNQLTVTDNGTGGVTLSLPSTIAIGSSQPTTIRSDGATSTFGGGIQASIVEGGQYIAGPYVLATSTTATSAFSGNIAVGRSATLGTNASDLLTVNSSISSNLIPTTNNAYDLGSTGSYWRRGYIDELTVNNLSAASSSIAGTVSNSFTINTDNATNDTEDVTLIFKRGSASPNALMTWNSSTDRFEFNMPVFSATGLFTSATSTNFGTTNFTLNSNTFTSLLGTGLSNVSGALTVNYSALETDFFRQGGNSFAATATLGTNDSNSLAFETNGSTKMTILSSGNVGIGTTSPYARLSVDGRGVFNQDVRADFFTATSTTQASTFPYASSTALTVSGGFYNSALTTTRVPFITTGGLFTDSSAFTFDSSLAKLSVTNASTTNLSNSSLTSGRVTYAGTGGLLQDSASLLFNGTTLTANTLAVTNGTTLSGALTYGGVTLANSVTGTGSMVLSNSPTLVTPALGTPSAVVLTNATGLPLTSGVTGVLPIANGGTNASSFTTSGNSVYWNGTSLVTAPLASSVTTPYASSTALTVSGSTYLATAGGNVGIGTASPSYKLDVAGFINTDQFSGYKQNGATILVASSTNSSILVGDGAGRLLDSTGLRSMAVGYRALYNATSSDNNTALGYFALTATTGGESNTAVGTQALTGNTTGSYNVALGDEVLLANTTGSFNTAIGSNAMRNANTGSRNFGLGYGALNVNTGSDNIGIGYLALSTNTSGTDNTGIGYNAFGQTTTGSGNIGIGYTVALTNKTGTNNVAIGTAALYSNTSATSTVAIGYLAAYGSASYSSQGSVAIGYYAGRNFLTGSDYNTLVGYKSGDGITTGSRNVLLGQSIIAASYNQVTTGSNNIAIGNDVAVPSATANNQLVIGNLIYGTGLSGTGATVSTGNIGIGTTTPERTLTVNGSGLFARADASPQLVIRRSGSVLQDWGFNVGSAGQFTIEDRTGSSLNPFTIEPDTPESTLYLDSTGNVGIGTTNPNSPLTVTRNGSGFGTQGTLTLTNTSLGDTGQANGSELRFQYGPTDTTWATAIRSFATAGAPTEGGSLQFLTDNTSGTLSARMTIDSAGNVGIGTTGPGAKLDVRGAFALSGAFIATPVMRVFSTNTAAVNSGASIALGGETGNATTPFAFGFIRGAKESATADSYAGYLAFNTVAGSGTSETNSGDYERLRITSTGNVGIGTTTPGANLVVNGTTGQNLFLIATSTNQGILTVKASGQVAVGSTSGANTALVVYQNSSSGGTSDAAAFFRQDGTNAITIFLGPGAAERMRVTSAGNIGVANAAPTFLLDMATSSAGTTNSLVRLRNTDTAVNSGAGIQLDGFYAGGRIRGYTPNAGSFFGGQLDFDVNNDSNVLTTAMSITKAGNVGIGTVSPETGLVLNTGSALFKASHDTISATTSWANTSVAARGLALSYDQVNTRGRIASVAMGESFTPLSINASTLSFNTGAGSVTERMTITTAGNVGIGTASPGARLHVLGSDTLPVYVATSDVSASYMRFFTGSTVSRGGFGYDANGAVFLNAALSTANMVILNGGNVGIGTTSPFKKLSVDGDVIFKNTTTGATQLRLSNIGSGASAGLLADDGSGTEIFSLTRQASNTLSISSYGDVGLASGATGGPSTSYGLILKSTGNVGIGTTSPTSRLQVQSGTNLNVQVGSTAGSFTSSTYFPDLSALYNTINLSRGSDGAFTESIFNYLSTAGVPNLGITSRGDIRLVTGAVSTNTIVLKELGNVGIGDTTPDAKLDILQASDAAAQGFQISRSNDTDFMRMYMSSGLGGLADPLIFSSSFAGDVAAIGRDGGAYFAGKVGIGTTSPSAKLAITQSANTSVGGLWLAETGNTDFRSLYMDTAGVLSFYGGDTAGTLNTATLQANGAFTNASDRAYKENVTDLNYTLADIRQLQPRSFTYKETNQQGLGFIAQELKEIVPEVVYGTDGKMSVDYASLSALALAGVKELDLRTLSLAPASENTQAHALAVSTDASIAGMLSVTGRGAFSDSLTAASLLTEGSVTAATFLTGTSETLPEEVLTGGNADLFKMASYAITGMQALSERTDLLATRIDEIDARVAALESSATSEDLSGAVGFSIATLKTALRTLGIYLENGLATFETLVFRQLAVAKDTNGDSSAGSQTILAGNTVTEVENPYVLPTSKIFVTFTGPIQGAWYISNKEAGKFRVTLADGQSADVSFDYFILQTEGQLASPGAAAPAQAPNNAPAPSNDPLPPVFPGEGTGTTTPVVSSGDTTPPTITLNGPAAREIDQGATWVDQGATASDETDGDLTGAIQVQGTVNTSTPGTYTVSYSVSDAAGNEAHVSRIVSVQSVSASEPAPSSEPEVTVTEPAPAP